MGRGSPTLPRPSSSKARPRVCRARLDHPTRARRGPGLPSRSSSNRRCSTSQGRMGSQAPTSGISGSTQCVRHAAAPSLGVGCNVTVETRRERQGPPFFYKRTATGCSLESCWRVVCPVQVPGRHTCHTAHAPHTGQGQATRQQGKPQGSKAARQQGNVSIEHAWVHRRREAWVHRRSTGSPRTIGPP